MGSTDWLLAVVGAVAVRVTKGPPSRLELRERRDRLEIMLRSSGLAYGTGAVDPAVELASDATPGARAFAHFVAGLVRLCAKAAALSAAPYFVDNKGELALGVTRGDGVNGGSVAGLEERGGSLATQAGTLGTAARRRLAGSGASVASFPTPRAPWRRERRPPSR